MTSEKANRKEKNQNIQVFVRLRPLNQRERDIKSLGVVDVVNNREVVVRQSQQTSLTKRFTYDRAFGPYAKQVEIYQEVVSPLIEEVLAGYNCTVFAYGQTGTGKTHTMVGENTGDETTWQNDPLAGIIPRALSQLFDELRISNTEYTVRVSYLELYNEELFDLLSSSEDNSKLRIYEDVTRKGSNIVNGLEEITVYNKNEVYKIMAQGQERKRVASTLMNAQSSRSHTVFTIVVHMKENSPEGEELVKIGKLNLVDLAGSENISKAGSDNPAKKERARECVNINQSLLTLGRVITALVERHPHIPYRESKLTRILQESLGGRTKTSIIATISPGHKDLEETMSTLEYAYRAKNIQNKPEINQKMTKKAILKEYAEEIDRLKRDLQAARDKNGVYLANETFTEMTLKQEEQRKEIQELLLKKRAMEEERERMEIVFAELSGQLEARGCELKETKGQLRSTEDKLANTTNVLKSTQQQFEEQRHLAACRGNTERELGAQAEQILAVAHVATVHVSYLHDSVDKRKCVEGSNLEVTRGYREESAQARARIAAAATEYAQRLAAALSDMQHALDSYAINSTQSHEQNESRLKYLVLKTSETLNEIKSLVADAYIKLSSTTDTQRTSIRSKIAAHSDNLQQVLEQFVQMLNQTQERVNGVDFTSNVANFIIQWRTSSQACVSSLQQCQSAFGTRASTAEKRRFDAARTRRDSKRSRFERRVTHIKASIAAIEEEKVFMDKRLKKQLEDIENERHETEERLKAWMEEERRLLEERLARHVAIEKKALEDRLQKKVAEIEQEKKLLEETIARHIEAQQTHLQANEEDMEMAEGDLEECEKEKVECLQNVDAFVKEFEKGTHAISADIEAVRCNVLQIVQQFSDELKQALQDATQHIQQEVTNLLVTDKETSKQLTDSTDAVLSDVMLSTKRAMDTVVDKIEANSTTSIEELNHISSSSVSLKESAATLATSQGDAATSARTLAAQLEADVRAQTDVHAQIENRYLAEQYRIYSPTGKTPIRQEYRYPRSLAATSPPERLLARFRASRQNTHDEECIVIESDGETRLGSDSESSISEDSAVAFAAPSPPALLAPSAPDTHNSVLAPNAPNSLLAPSAPNSLLEPNAPPAIAKSISETDIYAFRKQQQRGKENPNRSVSSIKKPSKLPAPTSHKRPLMERNIST